jgi:ribonuclease E
VLDSDTTGTPTDAGAAPDQNPTSTSAPRRRRAAARPAGPPSSSPSPTAEPAAEGATKKAAPAKKATRSRAKKAAAAPTTKSAAPAAGDVSTQTTAPTTRSRSRKAPAAAPAVLFQAPPATSGDGDQGEATGRPATKATRTRKKAAAPAAGAEATPRAGAAAASDEGGPAAGDAQHDDRDEPGEAGEAARRRRRRRGGRGRRRGSGVDGAEGQGGDQVAEQAGDEADHDADHDGEGGDEDGAGTRRRRRRRRKGSSSDGEAEDGAVVHVREPRNRARSGSGDVTAVRGSTRLEAKKQRRREGRDAGRRRPPILSEAEFLARRESVSRVMVVRQRGDLTQIGVLEDDVLVEHYVASASSSTMVGNVYLGKVQNVLPSMEAAFVDIGRGRNAVLYAGEVNWDAAGLDGQPKRIEHVLKSGDSVLVQVTKDPIGHKGSRLTSNISLAGRFLVYVPDGSMSGISRKLPDKERSRLKAILKKVVPDDAGVIVRTAAEGATEEQLTHDVARLTAQWDEIEKSSKTASAPALLYSEPDLTVRVVRDLFNEDFEKLVVQGDAAWDTVQTYVGPVAPDLLDRVHKHVGTTDLFTEYRVDEQIAKALDRKVWLPSGGSLVIDRTEAMTVVDVNTGKFVGKGSGNLEETVTRNNLEAAEEIVRQLRLRDIGGIIVIDFIDMVLESNRELVLRRLTECLGRDRTKHQVAEVTSLGLVQMTRKRIGQGLLEAFSEPCEVCNGRGVKVHLEPVEARSSARHSGENIDRVGRVARAAKSTGGGSTGSATKGGKATSSDGDVPDTEPADGDQPAEPAARPRRRRATRSQGEPAPVV